MARPSPLLFDLAARRRIDPGRVTDDVVESAIEHRMSGLLLADLEGCLKDVPHSSVATLTAFDLAVASRRRQQMATLARIHAALSRVDHALFKGAASAGRWFEEPSHRLFADIDIVLGPGESMAEAVAAIDPRSDQLPAILRSPAGILSSVTLSVDGVTIDLQSDPLRMGITPRHPMRWWEATEWLEIDGVGRVRVFDAAADLVLFLLHQARDRFRYLSGVAEAARRFDANPDWPRVEELARGEGVWDQVAVAAEVMCQELGRACQVVVPNTWRTRMWRRLWAPEVRLLGEVGRIRHVRRANWLMPLSTVGRLPDALLWIARAALPPPEILNLRHPEGSGPYLWRLVSNRVRVIGRRRMWVWRHKRSRD